MAVDMQKVAELLYERFDRNVIEVYPDNGRLADHLSVQFRHWRTTRFPVALAEAGPYAVAACVGDQIAGMLKADADEREAWFAEQVGKAGETK